MAPISENDDLRERIKALGLHMGAKELKPKSVVQKYKIEDVIKTREENTPLGSALVYEELYPREYQHGDALLTSLNNYQFIANWANIESNGKTDPQKLLFLDTETSGLSSAAGTFAFLIGLGFLKDDGFHILQIIMPSPHQEPALLAVFGRLAVDYETIVTFNGKSFDIPLLEHRHILYRIPTPFDRLQHIDLLHLARKLWRNRLSSRRLSDLEQSILHFRRAKEEVPGWLVPEIYKDYLHTGDARPLSGVFYHNAVDVLSLAGIFTHIANILNQPFTHEMDERDLAAVGNIFEDMGSFESAKMIYQKCMHVELPVEIYYRTLRRLAGIYKKELQWDQAVSVWQRLAENDIGSCIELAKYYEHVTRSYPEAINYTRKAFELYRNRDRTWLEYNEDDLKIRYDRLIKKMDNKS
ncbi:MAG: ribonuclease H-like domain-containing protein [Chloroflexi bacterium]|nr:ribonuclease H-like domain-containing protein [Chloroflexota bacterium]